MKNIFLILVVIFYGTLSLLAQIDQVSIGGSYSEQAYYNIATGDVYNIENDAWDIAFTSVGLNDAGVFINESSALMSSGMELYETDHSSWDDVIENDGSFNEEFRLYNSEESWTEGAFNSVKDKLNPFDYGWGEYSPTEHEVIGSKIYVIKLRNGRYIKFQIQSLDVDGRYNFRYADLDGSHENVLSVDKNDAGESELIYFSLSGNYTVNIPHDYDLVFQRYATPLEDGTDIIQYVVSGALIGPGVQAVAALGVDPGSVNEVDFASGYSTKPNSIGHDWKFFDLTTGWTLRTDLVYFLKTEAGKKYMIEFLDFEGSSTGITTLRKTYLGTSVNIETEIEGISLDIYPNPFTDFILLNDESNRQFEITISDINGVALLNTNLSSNEILNIPSTIKSGSYYIRVTTKEGVHLVRKLIKL